VELEADFDGFTFITDPSATLSTAVPFCCGICSKSTDIFRCSGDLCVDAFGYSDVSSRMPENEKKRAFARY
jgi:hypothetical protein